MKQLANPIRLTYGYAYAATFMPDGKMLMVGTHGGALLWDFHRRKIMRDFYRFGHPAQHMAITPDGLALITGSEDVGQVLVWDIASAAVLHRIPVDAQGLWWMAASPRGGKLLTCGRQGGLRCWDLCNGELTLSVPVRTANLWRAAWSPCGGWIAHSNGTRRVRVVDADSGATVLRIDAPCKKVTSLAFHPDGCLFTGLENGTIQTWDIANGRWKEQIAERARSVRDIMFSRDGRFMLDRDTWPTAHVTDLHSRQLLQRQGYDSDPVERNIDLSPDGKFWAGTSYGYEVGVFRTGKTGTYRVLADDFDYLYSARFTPDGQSVLVGNHKNGESLYRVSDGVRQWCRHRRESYGQAWAVSSDSRWMASGMDDGRVVLRDMTDGRLVAKLMVHGRQVLGVKFLATGNRIVTCGHEGTLTLLQYSPPELGEKVGITLLKRLGLGCMNDAKLSSNGKTLVTASPLGVHVWDAESRSQIYHLALDDEEAGDLCLSPDDRSAAVLLERHYTARTVLIWDLHSGKFLCRITGGVAWKYVSFSPNGRFFCLCGHKKEHGACHQVVQARVTETGRLLWAARLKQGTFPNVVVTTDTSKVVVLYCREVKHRSGKDRPRSRRYRREYAPCIRVFDAGTGKELVQYRQNLPAAEKRPSLLSEGAASFFLSVEGGETRLRNAFDAAMVKRLSFDPGYAEDARLSPEGEYVYFNTSDLSLWDTKADEEVDAPSTDALAASSGSPPRWHGWRTAEYVRFKDLARQTIRTYSLGHYSQDTDVHPLPDGDRMFVVGEEHYALWDPNTDKPEWTMWCASGLNTLQIRAVEICASPDVSLIALGLRDKSGIFLLDSRTGAIMTVIDTPEPVSSLAFSSDGARLMAALGASGIRVWDVVSGGEVSAIAMPDGTALTGAFYCPDEPRILAYCKCGESVPQETVRIMDADDGTLLAEFPGEHNDFALKNPISPDGSKVLTEERSTVFLWDISGL